MKRILFLLLIMISINAVGQLSVNILTPSGGMMDKQQLWNIVVTNTEQTALSVQLQVSFAEVSTGQPVFTASVASLMITPGTTQLTPGNIGAVQFNIINPDYQIDPGPNGLLPVGTFIVCYNFLIDKYNKVVRECQQVNIPPLGPLLLIQPVNTSIVDNLHPLFSWLPFAGTKSLNHLRYDFRLVEMQEGQTAADAVRNNLPLFNTSDLTGISFPYTGNATTLEPGKDYAWQIIALNNVTPLTKSDVWSFHTKENASPSPLPKAEPVFFKLNKEGMQHGDIIFWGNLRFDFFNESGNNNWKITVDDLSSADRLSFSLPTDGISIHQGQNLVNYNASTDKHFADRHLYLLKATDLYNQVWQLRFEYRKPRIEANK